ncbi:MAG TPA: hypothetical protein VG649_09925 [Candidatus Angelobacter sp.]|nr:hypothetical protein [Candidatus Angelobacter sp.]
MNALGWTILYLEDFLTPTEAYTSDLENRLSASPSDKEAEKLLLAKAFLEAYILDASRILRGERNPFELPAACEANRAPIPNFYVLRVGPWRGYYRLDYVAKLGVGVLTLHEGHNLQGALQKVLNETLKKAGRPE